jgi:hypothetical protein
LDNNLLFVCTSENSKPDTCQILHFYNEDSYEDNVKKWIEKLNDIKGIEIK